MYVWACLWLYSIISLLPKFRSTHITIRQKINGAETVDRLCLLKWPQHMQGPTLCVTSHTLFHKSHGTCVCVGVSVCTNYNRFLVSLVDRGLNKPFINLSPLHQKQVNPSWTQLKSEKDSQQNKQMLSKVYLIPNLDNNAMNNSSVRLLLRLVNQLNTW